MANARTMDAQDTVRGDLCDLASGTGPPAPNMIPTDEPTIATGKSGDYYCYIWP